MRQTDGLDTSKAELEQIKEKHDYRLMVQRQYQHMIHRMKTDLIAIQIKFNETQDSFKNKEQVYKEESDRNRQAKQERLQAQHRLEELMRLIDQDHF